MGVKIQSESQRLRLVGSQVERLFASYAKAEQLMQWRPLYGGLDRFKHGLRKTIDAKLCIMRGNRSVGLHNLPINKGLSLRDKCEIMPKNKILIVGAFPPPQRKIFGGIVTSCQFFLDSSFARQFELLLVDNTQISNPPAALAHRGLLFCCMTAKLAQLRPNGVGIYYV